MIRKETRSFELLERTLQDALEDDTVIAVLPVPNKNLVRGYRIMIGNSCGDVRHSVDRSWFLTKEEMCTLGDILIEKGLYNVKKE